MSTMTTRKCGSCTMCCTAMAVRELDKPNGVKCQHLTPTGCGIYEDRPEECRRFECLFLQGIGDLSTRPDRTGGVLTMEDGGLGFDAAALMVYTNPGNAKWERSRHIAKLIDRQCRRGSGAFIVSGDKRKLITFPGSRLAQMVSAARDMIGRWESIPDEK